MNEVDAILSNLDVRQLQGISFKRGIFDFIVETPKGKHEKQEEALRILTDNETEEFLYGGAAGGAKSWTGCCWLMFQCWNYPGTRWFIGREELKRITESTLITFFKVAMAYGLRNGVDFKYNGQKNFIQFKNGSRIDLLELKFLPRDPVYERFGSTEYTGGWIEEGGEIDFGAYDVLKTRIGRQYNERYNLIGKLFITCNPKKNWMYKTFYLPNKKGTLPPIMKYLAAFVQDNPHIDKGYVERLKRTKDKAKKERLLHGNWEYDDDPNAMCKYDDIIAMFTNTHIWTQYNNMVEKPKWYITADIARFGSDKARIGVWWGWILMECHSFEMSSTLDIQACINAMRAKWSIPAHHCIADDDGVGGGTVDVCGILGFVNNAAPIITDEAKENENRFYGDSRDDLPQKENYKNLQTQCAYLLADDIAGHHILLKCIESESEQQEIQEEFSWLKTYKSDDENKLRILPKKEVKKEIGRSPDWRDLILMRKYFDLVSVEEETNDEVFDLF